MAYKRILVPVDGSPTAAKGMKAAIRLVRESRGKLLLLHVVEEYSAFIAPEVGASIVPILDSLRLARVAGQRRGTGGAQQHHSGATGSRERAALMCTCST